MNLNVPSESPNIRAASCFLAESMRNCWRCSSQTHVFGIVLPAGYEALQVADDPIDDRWQMFDEPTQLSYVSSLANPVHTCLSGLAPLYRTDFSQTTRCPYRMNHCERCGAKLGDFETVEERGAALSPVSPEAAAKILLREILAPFFAACGAYNCGLEWFGYARRCTEVLN